MRRFIHLTAILGSLCLATQLVAEDKPQASPQMSINDLKWLEGVWNGEQGGTETEEQWMAPKGGLMLGMNRTVHRGGKVSFEFLRIAETKDGIVYFASPGGQPATPFKLKGLEDHVATFENLDHDFPQRIIYRREKDVLHARIEGKVNGQDRSMEWTWRAASAAPLRITKD